LVMGKKSSGKSYLLNLLPEGALNVSWITMAGLKQPSIVVSEAKSIVLYAEHAYSGYRKFQLIEVAKKLAEQGKFVYIHCYPQNWKWLKKVFE